MVHQDAAVSVAILRSGEKLLHALSLADDMPRSSWRGAQLRSMTTL
jgi:hypothetical protein